jgi:3-methyladenine DNA glycosylase/8-oxoguanine DNA glycosylase
MRPAELRRAVRHLRRADPVLARLVDHVGPCRYEVHREIGPFAYLTTAIVHQQLAGAAAATIHRRLCALAGRKHPRPEDIARLSDAELRGVGLSRQKIGYLRDLVARVGDGLPLGRLARLPDEAAIEALTSVKGIGRWTSEMFLMFRLGRLDVLPVDDLGIRKAMQKAYRKRSLPKPDWMRKTAEPWRPYRSVACWYLWRSLDG